MSPCLPPVLNPRYPESPAKQRRIARLRKTLYCLGVTVNLIFATTFLGGAVFGFYHLLYGMHHFGWFLPCWIFGCSVRHPFEAGARYTRYKLALLLDERDDADTLRLLIETYREQKLGRKRRIGQRIARLVNGLSEARVDTLSADDVASLTKMLGSSANKLYTPYDPELTVAILRVLAQRCNSSLVPMLERLRKHKEPEIANAAQACYVALCARTTQLSQPRTLLRPSATPIPAPDTLLRPSQSVPNTVPESEMLRAGNAPPQG